MISRLPRLLLLCGLLLTVSIPATAQAPAKGPLKHSDYAGWRAVQAPVLSADGTAVAYAVTPQEGDGEFVTRNLRTGREYRHPNGSRPTVPVRPAARAGRGRAPRRSPAARHLFSPDGKIVVFPIYPSRADKGKPAAAGTALGLMTLADGKVTRIDRVLSYQLPEEGPALLVYQRLPAVKTGSAGKTAPASVPARAERPRPVSELVLRNLADGKERSFADVSEYTLSKNGQWLVYAIASKKEDANGVCAVTPGREAPPLALCSGPGKYSRLTWDEKQSQLAFLHARTTSAASSGSTARPQVRICYWKPRLPSPPSPGERVLGAERASVLTPVGKPALRPGCAIGEGGLSFSPDGRRVYFTVAPPSAPKATAPGQEKAVVELWHHRDDFIQPMQKVRYTASPTYRAVFHLDDRSCRQLSDEALASVQPAAAGDWALGRDDRPYRPLVGSEASQPLIDAYLINMRSGTRKLLVQKQAGPLSLSPGGKYALCYDGKDWHSLSVPEGKRVNLTAKLGVSFASELHDTPSAPPPYGVAGWTGDDKHVLLYDRYDVWMIAPDGSGARNLTGGLGRKTTTQLRVVRLGESERALDPAKPLLARAENEWTRDTGFYRVSCAGDAPRLLIMGARNYSTPLKARKADTLLLHVSTFSDYPDLFVADADFREVRRVSEANPHKAGFVWGKASLVRYKSADGTALSGVLIKPEDFDPKKKYPLLVYIYERLSGNLHRFVDPQPGTSINPSYYASNGYLVLMPDITYTVGHPGQSALKCVLPAIQAVVDQGCVNEKAIGIQGHSWGGYQAAYLITQTTRFRAAAAGAPVSNMTSAYGGIRWGTGLPRQFQYEKTQSRIGGTLWQYPMLFVENSPLFHADRVTTPLLMLHNDKDEAVPWQQGIEYYLALRRLGKEVYLFNYPGEMHGLRRRVNQMDYTVRMQEFFDHHLKGAAKPGWMKTGIPYTPPPGGREETPGRPMRRPRS